jgi:hypothetical protein
MAKARIEANDPQPAIFKANRIEWEVRPSSIGCCCNCAAVGR